MMTSTLCLLLLQLFCLGCLAKSVGKKDATPDVKLQDFLGTVEQILKTLTDNDYQLHDKRMKYNGYDYYYGIGSIYTASGSGASGSGSGASGSGSGASGSGSGASGSGSGASASGSGASGSGSGTTGSGSGASGSGSGASGSGSGSGSGNGPYGSEPCVGGSAWYTSDIQYGNESPNGIQDSDRCGRGRIRSRDRRHRFKKLVHNKMADTSPGRKTKAEVDQDAKIVNGVVADVAAFPWVVSLMFKGQKMTSCGGSLITPSWVLTAAHCVYDIWSACDVTVRIGEHDFASNSEMHEDIQAYRFFVHQEYRTLKHDVALIKLQRPAKIAHNHISTLCLSDRPPPPVGTRCIVAGWGRTQYGDNEPVSEILRWAELTLLAPSACRIDEPDKQLCAMGHGTGYSVGDSCQGDSGGALFCEDSTTVSPPRYYQIGIVSYGLGNSCGHAHEPGVYVNVHSYMPWIRNVMMNN